MDTYYRTQLQLLREGAARFARAHPALAPMLLGEGSDPDVERILEGTAYLCGKIHERLDSTAPEFITALLRLVFPQALLPLPSLTLLSFSPLSGFAETTFLPAMSKVASVPVDGVACQYSTMHDLNILPMSIRQVSCEQQDTHQLVSLTLASAAPLKTLLAKYPLTLHVTGSYDAAVRRYFALRDRLVNMEVHVGAGCFTLPARALVPCPVPNSDPRIVSAAGINKGYMEMLRYFTLPEAMLSLRLSGLSAQALPEDAHDMTLTLRLTRPQENMPAFDANAFALHVVPAINLFDAKAEPINVDHRQEEYPVILQNAQQLFLEILDITAVTALESGGNVMPYRRYESFRTGGDARYYTVSCRQRDEKPVPDYFICPLYHGEQEEELRPATFSVTAACCNHTLPTRLRPGDVCRPTDSSPAQASFTNITKPTPTFPRLRVEAQRWAFLAHLNTNLLSMASAEGLRSLLELYIMNSPDAPEYAAINRRRCGAIQHFSAHPEDRLYRGRPLRGFQLQLTLASSGFTSTEDMLLFAQSIDRFVATFTPINTYSRLKLTVSGTGEIHQWPPRLGEKQLL